MYKTQNTNTMNVVKKIILSIVLCSFGVGVSAQVQREKVSTDLNFNNAYHEFADMLEGKKPLSIKRAVFLTEWAYLDGKPDYETYCRQIDSAAEAINQFISANHLDQIPTGKNVALFEYFARPYPMNRNKPFTYDFNDISATEDLNNYFVTKVMRTHSGQCRSLPTYYKILAEAIGAEAYLTLAPQHLFVRHRHETDPNQWRNVELTTQSLSREVFYIEHFGITDEMIRNKVYMNPLSDKETVALLLTDLTLSYQRKYNDYDSFVSLTIEKALEYFPQNISALINMCNAINIKLINYLKSNGKVMDAYAKSIDNQWYEYNDRLQKLGYKDMSDSTYRELLNGSIQAMKQQGMSEQKIEKTTNKLLEADKKTNLKP